MLIKSSKELFAQTKEKQKKKNHFYDKFTFNLYWNLYALKVLLDTLDENNEYDGEIAEIIKETITYNEYTIREKGAGLLNTLSGYKSNDEDIKILQGNFLSDTNFYVKNTIKYVI